ncbi:Uncharacterised protein [Escherichia coli]|uniref:hypothetical protein n=1 Tax=Escherichia coli TaxID=562 RepID=UPI001A439FF1|nr:hypothetical protein [Escherichia coli]VVZ27361.1 Uncharacterised protein [Escherichia coli]VVZ37809.1 Uncharacterised protein [Escherichia coli]VWN21341.1 Uncharacterised protein [Escherichia coli]
MKRYYGFIYQWEDCSNGIKYIGSHYGTTDDKYVSSNIIVNRIYKSRPLDLSRVVLEYIIVNDKNFLLEREQKYLDLILPSELYTSTNRKNKTVKYYNMKKNACGGNGGIGSNGILKNKIKYFNKNTLEQKFFHYNDDISDDWIKGVPPSKVSCSGSIWYLNIHTGENKRFRHNPGIDWIEGKRNTSTTPKKVSTPYGIFESASECSRQTGIKQGTVSFRCRSKSTNMTNWFYIEE